MTLIGFIPRAQDVEHVIEWTEYFTQPNQRINYVCLDDATEQGIRDTIKREELGSRRVVRLTKSIPVRELVELCRTWNATRLISTYFQLESNQDHPQSSEMLVRATPCETFISYFGQVHPRQVHKILMVATQGPHDLAALRLANKIRKQTGAQLTIATVEDETGTKAEISGKKAIQTLLHEAALEIDEIETKVKVDRLHHRGIQHCFDDHDLVIIGRDGSKDVAPLKETLNNTTTLLIKRKPPLSLSSVPSWIPQINPSHLAELLQDLRQGSRWNSDFIGMLLLASAIASLGLMQNSPAVVIGSMLLAPLMTPMVGGGFALAQANLPMAKTCSRSIMLGFLLTLAVSTFLGLITPSRETLSPEVLARGTPNVLDLLIALFSAIAATFAMARPNIAGAVAGVAIATALVPPVCAAGLSISLGKFDNALGALVLFATNLIAIIVASSFTFSMLGVTTMRSLPKYRYIAQLSRIGLIGLLVLFAGPLSAMLLYQLEEGRAQTAIYPVTRAVSRALHARVAQEEGVAITLLGRPSVQRAVLIHVAAEHELPRTFANELREVVREEMQDPDLKVIVVALDGQWRSDQEEAYIPPD